MRINLPEIFVGFVEKHDLPLERHRNPGAALPLNLRRLTEAQMKELEKCARFRGIQEV